MSKWFYAGNGKAEVTNTLRVGGSFRNLMCVSDGACDTATEMKEYEHTGKYLEIIPPEKLVFTWSSPFVTNSRVTVELKAQGDSTEVWITHDLLETEELRQSHNKGWGSCLGNLEAFLS